MIAWLCADVVKIRLQVQGEGAAHPVKPAQTIGFLRLGLGNTHSLVLYRS